MVAQMSGAGVDGSSSGNDDNEEMDDAITAIGECCPDCITPCADGAMTDTVTVRSSISIETSMDAATIRSDKKLTGAIKKSLAKNICINEGMKNEPDCKAKEGGGYPAEKAIMLTKISDVATTRARRLGTSVNIEYAYNAAIPIGTDTNTVKNSLNDAATSIPASTFTNDMQTEYSIAEGHNPAVSSLTATPSTEAKVTSTTAIAPAVPSDASSGMGTGAIVGIVIGCLAAVALVAVGAVTMSKRQAPTTNGQASTSAVTNPSAEGDSPTDTV
jgi:hypothetical protein